MSHQYLSLPGDVADYANTPDAAAIDIAGDQELIMLLRLADWTPASDMILVDKRESAIANKLTFNYRTDGTVQFEWTETGPTNRSARSTTATGGTAGEHLWLRSALDVDNGAGGYEVKFYTSTDPVDTVPGSVSWSQLGSTITGGATTDFVTTDATLKIGRHSDATGFNPLTGDVFRFQYVDGLGGTVVADFDADDFDVGDTDTATAVDSAGRTWTLHGAAEIQSEASGGSGNLLLLGVG